MLKNAFKKLLLSLLAIVAATLLPAPLLPAEDTQLTEMMKSMETAFGVIRQADPMSGQKVTRSAERIGTTYEDLIEFWRQRKVDKAVAISQTGKTTAVQLADAVHSGNTDRAAVLVKALGDTCRSCHEAYREKLVNGKYRIKSDRPAAQ